MTRTTPFKIITQGDVRMSHDKGYLVVGDRNAVCFFIDVEGRAYISASTFSASDCPVIYIDREDAELSTEIEFTEFPGWRFHAGGAGKSIAVALVRR